MRERESTPTTERSAAAPTERSATLPDDVRFRVLVKTQASGYRGPAFYLLQRGAQNGSSEVWEREASWVGGDRIRDLLREAGVESCPLVSWHDGSELATIVAVPAVTAETPPYTLRELLDEQEAAP